MSTPAWELRILAALCVVAALRILAYSAAFPLFNNVDEYAHFDLVAKYVPGHGPIGEGGYYDEASARLFVLYRSDEYLRPPEAGEAPERIPVWKRSPDAIERALTRNLSHLHHPNHEVHSPPGYYVVAGLWYRLGLALGFDEAGGVYWIRFLNALLHPLLVGCAYVYTRLLYPERRDLRLGVPLLIAFFPQDVFYGINSDVLSPLVFTLSLIALIRWLRETTPSLALAATTGLLVAFAVLVKLTNIGLLAILLGAVALRLARRGSRGLSGLFRSGGVAIAAAIVPLGSWLLLNFLRLGSWTGNAEKIEFLGWTYRSIGDFLDHPLFSPVPAWRYLQHLMAAYWRGEYFWQGAMLHTPGFDLFYGLSSWLLPALVGLAMLTPLRARAHHGSPAGAALNTAAWLLSVACLAFLSVTFLFGEATAPSRAYPFFAAGRLIIGTLVPFACLYVEGIAILVRLLTGSRPRLAEGATLAAVALLAAIVSVHDALLNAPAFASSYNWFQLP